MQLIVSYGDVFINTSTEVLNKAIFYKESVARRLHASHLLAICYIFIALTGISQKFKGINSICYVG